MAGRERGGSPVGADDDDDDGSADVSGITVIGDVGDPLGAPVYGMQGKEGYVAERDPFGSTYEPVERRHSG
jgi:hypothetical protein